METILGPDDRPRCRWCGNDAAYVHYHDTEWGFPVDDDTRLFEKLCLESFQSGLSWRTILHKRENFRAAFRGFDCEAMASFDDRDIRRLLDDEGIVRHRGKIEAVIHNARRLVELKEREGSLAAYVWGFESASAQRVPTKVPSTSPESVAMAKDLKRRGWRFLGPTTVYAFMQAMGLVNDHAADCAIRVEVEKARRGFKEPS